MKNKIFHPKVSIVIPVYNGSNYLAEAIDSALAQTYDNIEIIVVNDGSTDNGATEKIAKSYGDKIRYFSKENGGVATALNFGIEKMTGEYFSWLSHDDMYKLDRTKKMVRRLGIESRIDNLIVASSFTYFTTTAEFSPLRLSDRDPSEPLSYLFLGYINGCSILVPKTIIDSEGLFNEQLPTTQDFDYWFRILRKNKLIYLNEELTLSRSHEEQGSKTMLAEHIVECDELWINIVNTLSDSEKIRIFGNIPTFFFTIHDFLKANTLYKKAIFYMKDRAFLAIRESNFNDLYKPNFIYDWSINIDNNKKTIFFPIIGYFSDRGGLNKMVSMVANQLSEDYNVIVASFTDKTSGYELNDEITYLYMSEHIQGVDGVEDITLLFDVDLIVTSHNCFVQGLELIPRINKLGIPIVAWNHEDYFLPYTNPKFSAIWPVRNELCSKADAVIWLTKASCSAYSISADNGLVIPNFIHFEKPVKPLKHKQIYNNIIAAARFDDPRKRIGLLLETYEAIILRQENITLTILGTVDLEMSYSATETIGDAITRINSSKNNIKLVGFVNDIEAYYSKSDLNILPSYGEGFGLTILESAHYGVPSAVFNNSGFDDIIDDGMNGIIAPEAFTDILAERILQLYADKTTLLKMKKATRHIVEKFEEGKIIKVWKELVCRIIEKKSIKFPRYGYDEQIIKRAFNELQSSLSKFSYNFDYTQFIKLERENDSLIQASRDLELMNKKLGEELATIYNSKRWKYITKLADIKNRVIK